MMKSLCFLLLMLLYTGGRAQQQHTAERGTDVLRFDSVEAHFPRLRQESEPYAVHYGFANVGRQPVIIRQVSLSCGCLSADYPQGEVAPGERGVITITFRPKGYVGPIFREACLYTSLSDEEPTQCLKLYGEVLPPSDPWYHYPHHLGNLRAKQTGVTFRIRGRSGKMVEAVAVVNSGETPLQISSSDLPPYLSLSTTPAVIGAGEEADLRLTLVIDELPVKVRQTGLSLPITLKGTGVPTDSLPTLRIKIVP